MNYKLIATFDGEIEMVKRINDNDTESFIPFDPANTDYQAYLAWLAEGNTPEPADEVTE
jgi:hypothetical protein